MRIRVFPTPEAAGLYAATLVERVVLDRERPVLGLATGRTQIPFYHALVQLHRAGLDFSNVVSVNLDEYVGIEPKKPESFHFFMEKNFFHRVNIQPGHQYLPDGSAIDLAAECARFDAVLKQYPRDIQVLGIGRNGHIGFNEPSEMLFSHTHVVQLTAETRAANRGPHDPSNQVPERAITMGVQSILDAKEIVLLAFGREKAEVIRDVVHGEVRTDVPASLLQLHRNTTLVLDEACATHLVSQNGWVCA